MPPQLTPTHKQGDFACVGFHNGEALMFSLPRAPDGLGGVFQPALTAALADAQQQQPEQQPGVVHRIVAHTGKVRAGGWSQLYVWRNGTQSVRR